MTSLHHSALLAACAALLLAAPASAALIKPSNTSAAITLDVDLDSDVLTVTVVGSGTLAVSNDSGGHCSGSGTATVTCDHLAGMTVQGGSGSDTFNITAGAGNSGTYGLTVRGRKGGDTFNLSEAESGDLTILGDADQDGYSLTDGASTVTIGQTAVVHVGVGSGDTDDGETYTLNVTVNGNLEIWGTNGPDTFDVDGTVAMTAANQGGRFTLRTRGGADTSAIDITSVDGTLANQTAGYRAVFSTLCNGDGDQLTVTEDVSVTEKASYFISCASGDEDLDMSGVTVTVDGNGNTSEGGYVVLDGGQGTNTLMAPSWILLSNGTNSVTNW